MTLLIGGAETGLQNTTLNLLGRNDQTNTATTDNGDQIFVNVANGNLIYSHQDTYLPSRGEDYQFLRTYNSRAVSNDAGNFSDARWAGNTNIKLNTLSVNGTTVYELRYGDGSVYQFTLDAATGLYTSTQGDGAYETLKPTISAGKITGFVVTRADQSTLTFTAAGVLSKWTDTNGVSMTFTYSSGRLVKVVDDTGHTLTYNYTSAKLTSIVDETGVTLVRYTYDPSSRLGSVTDRYGHITRYYYTTNGYLERIVLPTQTGDTTVREIRFEYTLVNWSGTSGSSTPVLTKMTDAMGNVTTFSYAFNLVGNTYNGARTTVRDALGNVTTYECNASGFITKVIDESLFETSYTYDAKGNLSSVTDRNGWGAANSDSTYYRDLRESLGFARNLASLSAGNKTALLAMFTRRFTYDARGNVLTSADNSGNTNTFTYTAFNKISSVQAPEGGITRFFYDARQNLILQVDAGGDTTRYTYDAFGNLTDKIVYLDRGRTATVNAKIATSTVVTWTLAGHGFTANQAVVFSGDGTLPAGLVAGQVYYVKTATTNTFTLSAAAGAAAITFGANGIGSGTFTVQNDAPADRKQTTRYNYDAFGNNTSTVDAEGFTTSGVYDHFGNLLEFTDARGNKYLYTYDKDNRLLTITDPEGRITTNSYDAVGNRVAVTTGWNNHTVTSVYDKNNRLITTIDPSTDAAKSRTTTRSYDVLGNQTSVTDAEGRVTTYTYNARKELVTITTAAVDDDGNAGTAAVRYTGTIAYDGDGNRIAVTDNRNFTTSYQYTRDGLLRLETRADGQVTQYSYDRNQNLLSVVAGLQLDVLKRQTTTYAYDAEEQLVRVTDAKGNVTAYAYDAPGNMVQMTDAEGRVSRMSYDRNNQLRFEVSAEVTDPVTGLPTRYTVEHKFDGNGNEIETINQNGKSTLFAFDKVDRTTSVTDANGIVTTFGYDGNDNVTRVEIRGPGAAEAASVSTYVYDEFNQLLAETDGVGNALVTSDAATYQTLRKELGYTVGSGADTRAKLVSELTQTEKTALLAAFTTRYTYDKVGNLKTETDKLGRTTSLDYDALDRMVRATDAMGGTQQYRLDTGTGQLVLETQVSGTRQYRYDGNGNLLSETDELGRVTTYTHDTLGRVATRSDPLGSGTVTTLTTFVYDSFGNLSSRTEASGTTPARTTRYEYDLNNLLTAMIEPGERKTSYSYDRVGNRISMQDARGNSVDYSYDALDRVIKMRDPLTNEVKFEYDGVGNRIAIVNARGTRTRMEFDPGNRMTQMTDGEGRITRFSFDALGNTITVTTGAGTSGAGSLGEETARYEYDAESNLRAVVDADNKRSTYGFDRVYNQTSVTDARGNTTTTAFDALNRAVLVTDAEGGTTRYTYDKTGNALAVKDANGNVTRYAYDRANQLITETDALGVQTTYAYDAFGATTTITRAANRPANEQRISRMEYDEIGNLYKQIDQKGNFKQYTYDKNDNVTRVVDENGHHTDYSYDKNNRVTAITDHLGGVTRFSYDANGNRTVVEDAVGNKTTYFYNANNELDLMVDALGYATAYTYDANGNRVAQTLHATAVSLPVGPGARPSVLADSARDQTSRISYDALNRVTSVRDGEGGVTQSVYDAVGNLKEFRDPNGNLTRYTYDKNDRVTTITDARGGETSLSYDALGQTLSSKDANGKTTSYVYDALGRVTKETDPEGGYATYAYDAVGNLKRTEDQNRNETLYSYDVLDRMVRMTDAKGFYSEFGYDAAGNRTSVKDQRGNTTTYSFDALNRQVLVTNPEDDYMAYGYDAVGRLTSMGQNGDDTLLTLDALGRVAKRTDARGGEALISYDHAGNETSRQDESGVLTRFEYDRNNRLVATVDDSGKRSEFTYDDAGNLISSKDENGKTTHFGYDDLNRQVSETDPTGKKSTSTLDGVGNVVSLKDMNDNAFHVLYDGNNRRIALLSKEGYLTQFDYDAAGNEIERREYNDRYALTAGGKIPGPNAGDTPRVTKSTYNTLNQLKSQTDPTGLTLVFDYDAAGNRIKTTQTPPGTPPPGTTPVGLVVLETISYDDNNRVVTRTDGTGATTTLTLDDRGNILTKTGGVGTPGERTTTYTYDELGRLLTETNALGRVISYTYDASDRMTSRTTDGPDVAPRIERFHYDQNGRLDWQEDGIGTRTSYEYDAAGNTTKVTYAANKTAEKYSVRYEYDANNRLTAEIDGKGVRTEYVYDARGNKTETIQAKGVSGEQRTTTYAYDAQDRLISITNPENETTTYYYDAQGNQACIVDARGGITFNTFDDSGRILTNTVGAGTVVAGSSGANLVARSGQSFIVGFSSAHGGVTTTNTYDARGNVLSTSIGYADGTDVRTTTYEYDAEDQMTALTDAEGFTNRFEYDAFGNQTSITIGLYELAAGDAGHDADKAARAQPQTSLFFYDEADQLIKAIDGEGNVITNTYDSHGNKTSLTLGHINTDATLGAVSDDEEHLSTTTYGYDLAGKLTRTETAEGGVLKVERDALGREKTISRLQSGTEAAGVWSTVRYERDCFGRTTKETDANGIVTTTAYDELGNTTSSTRAFGTAMARTTVYEYDLMSRLVSQRDPLGGVTLWAYDDVGNLISITDAEGNVERSYYDEYNSLSGTVSATGLLTTFARDSAGNVLRTVQHAVLTAVPAGATLPAVAPNAGDRVFLQAFNGNNKRITETYSDGAVKRFEFDSCGLLISQTNSVATDDAALARTADKADRVMRWSWDASGRMVGFTNVDGVIETYTYDAANNRISTTIHDPNTLATGGLDADRITTYAYDDNNRLVVQTIGANRQELAYDKAGNVISKTDGRGSISRTVYDEGNRVLSLSDPKGGTVVYGYDAAGRLSSLSDARGNVRSFFYDKNDRLIEERAPLAEIFTIDGGKVSGDGITRRAYDKVGNLISNTDAAGFRTQWWYDADNRIVAEVNGDDVLRTYQYNAFGQVAAVNNDTVRVVNRAALGPNTVPTTSGLVATIRTEYDTRGRAILTTLPSVDVTTVSGTGTSTSVEEQALTERSLYDGWGNLVESVDRAGESSFAWYDARGRQIASVDAGGFLIETHFDSQDHVVRQTKYTTALSGTSAGSLPVSPSTGNAYSIDRYYSVEGNLIREVSPPVDTGAGTVRVETRFSYDAVGNMVSRTLAHGTAQAQTEHYYYDANNLRVAVVTAGRTLATFRYDANGNTIEQRRYANRVADGVNLDSVTANVLVSGSATPLANVDDQVRSFTYDARNLQSTRTEQMGAGTADDVVVQSWYDANGNNTLKIDGDGKATRLDYDANGNITRSISPNGAWSFVEYNTFGLKTRAWIGGDPDSHAPEALDIAATLANGSAAAIGVNWDFADGTDTNGLTAWIAWDTDSHASLDVSQIPSKAPNAAGIYANGSAASEDLESTAIPLSALTAGQTVYFRVMVQDSFGNLSWSAEQSVVVPPALQDVTVRQTGTDAFVIEADFSSAVSTPKVLVGGVEQAMVLVSGSRWSLSLTGVSDPAALLIGFEWTSGGQTYTSSTTDLLQAASAPQETGAPGWIEWQLPQQGAVHVGRTQLIVLDGALQPASASYRSNDTLQFDLPDLVAPATSQNYDIYYGDAVSETHTLGISFKDMQNLTATKGSYNRQGGLSNGDILSTNWNLQWETTNDGKVQTTIALGLDAAETDRISGDLQLSWRKQGSDGSFITTAAMTKADNDFSKTLDLDESTVYDIKLWYTDNDGKEVIVGWRRFTTAAESGTTPAGAVTVTGTDVAPASATRAEQVGTALHETDQHSLTVLASERGGVISGAEGSRSFTTGLYSGPVDAAALSAALGTVTVIESSAGEFQAGKLEGDAALFFTQIEYDALGRKIASNEKDGLWREYGLDANGNVVVTRLLGDDRDATVSINSFARFDARNREVETIGPVAGGQAAITVTGYDYAGSIISVQDPGNDASQARRYAYDSAGSVVSETDALGNVTQHRYDLLGNLVRTEDPLGHKHVFEYSYTGANANRLTASYYEGLELTTTETYGYDTFGRRTSMTKGVSGQTTTATITVSYDQRDQRVSVTDAEGNITAYEYDKRGHQTWVRDANGNVVGNAYDAMGRLSHQYSFTATPGTLAQAKIWLAAGTNLVTQQTVYDVFGNRIASIDPMGRRNSLSYGAFGRLLTAGDTSFGYDTYGRRTSETGDGKSITRSYDAAGRLTEVNDTATGTRTRTEYTYDAVGNRQTEKLWVSGVLKRSQTYSYNARQELIQWTDTAPTTSITQSYDYREDGNLKSVTNGSGTKTYTFDAADRITQTGSVSFSYDYAGNRASEGTVAYTYYKNGWLKTATPSGGATSTWTYDKVGNVLTRSDGSTTESNTYDTAYRITTTVKGSDTTRTSFDKSGRTLSTYVRSVDGDGKVSEFTYSYNYNADGQQVSVTASGTGSAYGTSISQYDVNGRLVRVDRGDGDGDGTNVSTFVYDSDGNIVERSEDGAVTRYLYALGNPMGEYTNPATPTLNTGNYAALKTIATGFADGQSAFPDSSIIQHTVAPGDTLQSIAGQYYGSPDLWFVIAEANGLTGDTPLEAGARLVVPSTVQNAYHTAETHALYKEGDIVGSKLPNITTPPPEPDKCAKIGAIILIVLVAIVAIVLTVLTVGAAAPAAALVLLGATASTTALVAATVVIGAVIGAAIAFAASVATQAILVGLLNTEWDWNAVLADTVAGFLGGAAAGLGAAVSAARTVSTMAKIGNVIGQLALEAAGETASQAIQNNGQIVSPWLILAAGAGGALGGVGDVYKRSSQLAKVTKGAVEASEATADLARIAGKTDDAAEIARRASLSIIDDVAETARRAGKSKWGQFSDVARFQFAEMTGSRLGKFTQTIAKGGEGGLANLADGKKIVRTFTIGADGVSAVADYKTVDRVGDAAITARIATGVSDVRNGASTLARRAGESVTNLRQSISKGVSNVKDLREALRFDDLRVSTLDDWMDSGRSRAWTTMDPPDAQALNTGKWERFSGGLRNASASAWAGLQRMGAAAGESVTNLRQSISKGVSKVKDLSDVSDYLSFSTLDDWMDSGRSRAWTTMGEPDVQALGTGKWERFSGGLRNASASALAGFQRMGAAAGESVRKGFSDLSDWAHTSKTTLAKFEKGKELRRYTDQLAAGTELDWNVRNQRGMDMLGGTETFSTLGTKRVRKTVRGVTTEYTVPRDRFGRTGKWERFRDPILGSSSPVTDIISGGLKNAAASASRTLDNIGGAVSRAAKEKWNEAAQGLGTNDGKKFWAYAVQDFMVGPGEIALRNYEENRSDTTSVSTSLYSIKGILRKGGKNITKINQLTMLAPALFPAVSAFQNAQRGEGWSLSTNQIARVFSNTSQQRRLDGQAADARGSTPFTDSNALGTYAEMHERQHNYLALEWRSVAANTSTSMLSPFSRDRAAGVTSLMQSNRMVSGEVNGFDSASVVAFAEASVGGVGGDPSKTPGWFG